MSRRTLLKWSSATLGGLGVLGLTGCGASDDDTAEPDPLLLPAARAHTDAATATMLIALAPDRADALATIADERTSHAAVLDAEIARVSAATTSTTAPPTTTAAPIDDPTVEQLRERLTRSQREAADLARVTSGYRAGILASISAACAAQMAVLLP